MDEKEMEKQMEREKIESEIRCLVSRLDAPTSDIGDWKVVKCYEAKLQDKPMPYDLEELMEERQKVRNRINELQEELEALNEQ